MIIHQKEEDASATVLQLGAAKRTGEKKICRRKTGNDWQGAQDDFVITLLVSSFSPAIPLAVDKKPSCRKNRYQESEGKHRRCTLEWKEEKTRKMTLRWGMIRKMAAVVVGEREAKVRWPQRTSV